MDRGNIYDACGALYMAYKHLKQLGLRNDASDVLRRYRRLCTIHGVAVAAENAGLEAPKPVAELIPHGFIRVHNR